MARPEMNRLAEMEIFVRTVETGGFSHAARAGQLTPSAVSKAIARLEKRLGIRLFNRSTRALHLTAEGAAFHERCLRILAEIAAAEQEAAGAGMPRGRLRVTCNVAVGLFVLLPRLPAFREDFPEVQVDVALRDDAPDLSEERADIAVRLGAPAPSRPGTRKLGETGMRLVAAPEYIKSHGLPKTPRALHAHRRLGFAPARMAAGWPFRDAKGHITTQQPDGGLMASDGESLRVLACSGAGIARLPAFHVAADIEAGRLLTLLDDFNPGDTETIHAACLGPAGQVSPRARAFLDFLAAGAPIRA